MMINYESKISKVLSILKFVITLPAIVFIILYWVKNNELFLTLVFVCTASFFLCDGSANLIEIPHCLRKECLKETFGVDQLSCLFYEQIIL